MAKGKKTTQPPATDEGYAELLSGLSGLVEQAQRAAARAVNGLLTATYWETGRRIVEFEQKGRARAEYGEHLVERLAKDLKARHGRGFSERNLRQMRAFYLGWEIRQTASAESAASLPAQERKALLPAPPIADRALPATAFPLPWSHYVRLLSVEGHDKRAFYEAEAVRGGWSVRQLDRQISTQFYERVRASKRPEALRSKGHVARPEDFVSPAEEVRDPYLLEFLNLKDEYSETELEDALIHHLEWFMMEMGTGLTFVARQKRILIDHVWYKMDLVFFHRLLRCLVVLDLKVGAFTPADAGQMNLYLNYAREHLMMPGEAEPIGIILCSDKNDAVVKYATGGIQARVFASTYLTNLPDEEALRQELLKTKKTLQAHEEALRQELLKTKKTLQAHAASPAPPPPQLPGPKDG